MAEQVEVIETYWSVCWAWFVPYPCKKHRTVKKWHYHFDSLVAAYRGIYTNYTGCELNVKYEWTKWEFTFRFEDVQFYGIDMYFDNKMTDSGPCVPVP